MKAVRLGDIQDFPFLEPPDYRQIKDGFASFGDGLDMSGYQASGLRGALLFTAIGLAIAGAGYRFGQYLAQKEAASPTVRATS